jgi:hypothetical protein
MRDEVEVERGEKEGYVPALFAFPDHRGDAAQDPFAFGGFGFVAVEDFGVDVEFVFFGVDY